MSYYTYLIPEADSTPQKLLYLIALASGVQAGLISPGSVTGGATYTTTTTGVGASASGSIPANATSWSFILLTGTGTFQGVSVPTGVPFNGTGPGSSAIPYTTGPASSALVMYQIAA